MLLVSYTTLGQLFYMAYFYMPSVNVEVTSPLAAAWTNDVMKHQLAAEISTFGGYGYVHVCSNSTKLSLLVKLPFSLAPVITNLLIVSLK